MYLNEEELQKMGFARLGKNVKISNKASIYSPQLMSFGDNVRVDDFAILSGRISFGSFIHIAAGAMIFAGDVGVEFGDFSGLSSRCAVYAVSDDYTGLALNSPVVPAHFRKLTQKAVKIGRHCSVGTGCTILPGANLAEGTAVGAMCLITRPTKPWSIYFNAPNQLLCVQREKNVLELERKLWAELGKNSANN